MNDEAPERLWMDPSGIDTNDIICGTINPPNKRGYLNCDTEYIRADIAQARIAELEAALREIRDLDRFDADIAPILAGDALEAKP